MERVGEDREEDREGGQRGKIEREDREGGQRGRTERTEREDREDREGGQRGGEKRKDSTPPECKHQQEPQVWLPTCSLTTVHTHERKC